MTTSTSLPPGHAGDARRELSRVDVAHAQLRAMFGRVASGMFTSITWTAKTQDMESRFFRVPEDLREAATFGVQKAEEPGATDVYIRLCPMSSPPPGGRTRQGG